MLSVPADDMTHYVAALTGLHTLAQLDKLDMGDAALAEGLRTLLRNLGYSEEVTDDDARTR